MFCFSACSFFLSSLLQMVYFIYLPVDYLVFLCQITQKSKLFPLILYSCFAALDAISITTTFIAIFVIVTAL